MKTSVDTLPHWDVSNIYPSLESAEFKQAFEELRKQLDDLAQFMEEGDIARSGKIPENLPELEPIVDSYLQRVNAIRQAYRTLVAYVYSFTTTDSYNAVAKRILSELQQSGVRLHNLEIRFQGWVGKLSIHRSLFQELLSAQGEAGGHSFFIQETAEQSSYLMAEPEERLASELSLSGGEAWEKLHGVVTSQLKADFEIDGEIRQLPVTVIQNYYNDPDQSLRRQAYDVELSAWKEVREPLAACLNGVKGEVNTIERHRGRPDPLESALVKARIDRDTLEAVLTAMKESFPAFRGYWQSKAHKLGQEKLPWWDLFAPVGQDDRRFSFDEAAEFIQEQFAAFSGDLLDLTRRAFDELWIDAQPRDGKVGGAFCMSIPSVEESRILCNFDGSFDQLATIAHELGHAYHNHLLAGKTQLRRRIPMTLAETASTFNQIVITDAMLSKITNEEQELSILESFLIDAGQVIVDIYSRYLFEREVFERRKASELTADDFCEIMLDCQRKTYGDGLDKRYLHPYMWAWKPHYYSPTLSFYNFPYAFGLLFGIGLYNRFRQGDSGFHDAYRGLLRDSGEATPADLASRFGIDISKADFWRESLSLIESRISRYIDLQP